MCSITWLLSFCSIFYSSGSCYSSLISGPWFSESYLPLPWVQRETPHLLQGLPFALTDLSWLLMVFFNGLSPMMPPNITLEHPRCFYFLVHEHHPSTVRASPNPVPSKSHVKPVSARNSTQFPPSTVSFFPRVNSVLSIGIPAYTCQLQTDRH